MAYLTINFCINWACYPPKGSACLPWKSTTSTQSMENLTKETCSTCITSVNSNENFTYIKRKQYNTYIFLTLKSSFPIPSVMYATKGLLRRSNCSEKGWNGMNSNKHLIKIHNTNKCSTEKANKTNKDCKPRYIA